MTPPDAASPQQEYLAALRAGDRRLAFALIDANRAAGMSVSEVYLDVLQPSLREVGRLWQENEMTVADEHLATAITQMVMARIYSDTAALSDRTGRTFVAACAGAERHDVGLRMVADLVELAGWDSLYLGAMVPADDLVRLVSDRAPDLLLLSVSIARHLPELGATIQSVRAESAERPPYILVGGRPFLEGGDIARAVGADASVRDAAEAVDLLRERFK